MLEMLMLLVGIGLLSYGLHRGYIRRMQLPAAEPGRYREVLLGTGMSVGGLMILFGTTQDADAALITYGVAIALVLGSITGARLLSQRGE